MVMTQPDVVHRSKAAKLGLRIFGGSDASVAEVSHRIDDVETARLVPSRLDGYPGSKLWSLATKNAHKILT
jgi:hypothetical protein